MLIVDGLERGGLAGRRPLSGPGRPVQVSATARGRRLMERAAARRLDAIQAAMDRLTAAERRRIQAAAPVLEHLARRLGTPADRDDRPARSRRSFAAGPQLSRQRPVGGG